MSKNVLERLKVNNLGHHREVCGNLVIIGDGLKLFGKPADSPPHIARAPRFYRGSLNSYASNVAQNYDDKFFLKTNFE
ncbi:MAG: hypothetical protein MUP61_01520 [Burkholderiales bacterium]|nr:hypothetical protein [Burkholderiales bacterium]